MKILIDKDNKKFKDYKPKTTRELNQDEEENEMNGWIDDESLQYMQEQTQKE